jgi:hypothetical protein
MSVTLRPVCLPAHHLAHHLAPHPRRCTSNTTVATLSTTGRRLNSVGRRLASVLRSGISVLQAQGTHMPRRPSSRRTLNPMRRRQLTHGLKAVRHLLRCLRRPTTRTIVPRHLTLVNYRPSLVNHPTRTGRAGMARRCRNLACFLPLMVLHPCTTDTPTTWPHLCGTTLTAAIRATRATDRMVAMGAMVATSLRGKATGGRTSLHRMAGLRPSADLPNHMPIRGNPTT